MANAGYKGKFENESQSQWRKQITMKENDVKETTIIAKNRINKNKIWPFEKTNKIDKAQASVIEGNILYKHYWK